MFLAFNNGIAATAEEVDIEKLEGKIAGNIITRVKDFQIVNGGQTTSSIYQTLKKDKADIENIFVQLKLTVVKDRSNFGSIVSRIAEYANTQNKVSVSDLSSNQPYHVELEKLSRNIVTPHITGQTAQTKWFFERARGQYKNARLKEGFTKSKERAFDILNPKSQMFTKEDLAKYVNSYCESFDGKKLVVGPHYVVRGNQKNYVQFINYSLVKTPNNLYYEDIIAKTILFKTSEKTYGIKPNAIGDMRYITVPYTISLLGYKTDYKLDLYKIWKNQAISSELKTLLHDLMEQVESFIKEKAPGALYGEWAKKEECWNAIKLHNFNFALGDIKSDLIDPNKKENRRQITDNEISDLQIKEDLNLLKSVPTLIWRKIEEWGKTTGLLSQQQKDVAFNLGTKLRNNAEIDDYTRNSGKNILAIVVENAPEILYDADEIKEVETQTILNKKQEINIDLIKKIVTWDRKNKVLKPFEYTFMAELAEGKKTLTERNIKVASWNLAKIKRSGFSND